jgi:hypothetical protein
MNASMKLSTVVIADPSSTTCSMTPIEVAFGAKAVLPMPG